MYEYRQIISRMRLGESDRAIAKAGLMGRNKAAALRATAVQRSYGECAEDYGFIISPCPPGDPKKKGRVEAGGKYVKHNFLPLKTFRSLADANQQLKTLITTIKATGS